MVDGGSHDSGNGLKLNLLSRLDGETSLEWPWLVRGANVSSEETLLRDMAAMPSKATSTADDRGGDGGDGGRGQIGIDFCMYLSERTGTKKEKKK